MPDREDGAGDGGHSQIGEGGAGQGSGQAGVLHTDLDGDGLGLGYTHVEQFAKAETAILQLTPEKADLENIFIELTDAQPDGKEPRHESDL